MNQEKESFAAFCKLTPGTVDHAAAQLGLMHNEPLYVIADGLLRYAKAYAKCHGVPLCTDGVLGEPWLEAHKGVRALLDGDGAVAMERGLGTDSKSNGMLIDILESALAASGYKEGDR